MYSEHNCLFTRFSSIKLTSFNKTLTNILIINIQVNALYFLCVKRNYNDKSNSNKSEKNDLLKNFPILLKIIIRI